MNSSPPITGLPPRAASPFGVQKKENRVIRPGFLMIAVICERNPSAAVTVKTASDFPEHV
jgi:hypothetical protein